MNTPSVPPAAAGVATSTANDDTLWHHPLFCRLALPLRSGKGPWSRHAGDASIRIEPNAPDGPLPSGRLLRLILLRVCDAAVRAREPIVRVGDDPSAWFAALGIEPGAADLRDLPLQMGRLAEARVEVSVNGGPALTMFDARGRPRGGDATWAPGVRLNGRFLAGLLEGAVPLGRDPVRALWRAAETLDAYAWAMGEMHRSGGEAVGTAWDDLRGRFAPASRDEAAFRTSFGEALRVAVAADPSIAVAMEDARVVIRPAGPDAADPLPHGTPPARDVPDPGPAGVQGTSAAPAGLVEASGGRTTPAGEAAPALRADGSGDTAGLGDTPGAAVAVAAPPVSALPDPVSLSSRRTGVPVVLWLRHGQGEGFPLVGVTPGNRLDLGRLTVLAVEPMVLQVEGGLAERDFDQAAAWIMANRDLIDDVWEGRIASVEELDGRVQTLRAPGWR